MEEEGGSTTTVSREGIMTLKRRRSLDLG